jgi:type VI secretion system protein ImpM
LFLLRHANYDTLASTSFWWTEGGAGFPPIALCAKGLPDPFSYSTLLTGKLPNNEPVDQS